MATPFDLTLAPVDKTSVEVQFRAIMGHPVPFSLTVQRRAFGEEWATVSGADLERHLRLPSAVGEWLQGILDDIPARVERIEPEGCLYYR